MDESIVNNFFQWRQFTFFDAVPVKDIHDLDSTPDIFKVCSQNPSSVVHPLTNLPWRRLPRRYLQSYLLLSGCLWRIFMEASISSTEISNLSKVGLHMLEEE